MTTAQVDIAIAGATGAVSYAWSQISGDEGWTIVSPSGASTTFRFTVATAGEIRRAAFVCRVVDAGTGKAINITVGAAALYNV